MKRALLVGINAYPSPNALRGCVNDVMDMKHLLVTRCGFTSSEITVITDAAATTEAIRKALENLLKGLSEGEQVVFHYSGHGAQMKSKGGEADGLDEVICPVDFDWSEERAIRDKEFHDLFSKIPAGADFVWVSDSCHSGDLSKLLIAPGVKTRRIKSIAPTGRMKLEIENARARKRPLTMMTAARTNHVALLNACAENQTSDDADFGGRANGAFTYFLLKALNTKSGLTAKLSDLPPLVAKDLSENGYSQTPGIEGDPAIEARPFPNQK